MVKGFSNLILQKKMQISQLKICTSSSNSHVFSRPFFRSCFSPTIGTRPRVRMWPPCCVRTRPPLWGVEVVSWGIDGFATSWNQIIFVGFTFNKPFGCTKLRWRFPGGCCASKLARFPMTFFFSKKNTGMCSFLWKGQIVVEIVLVGSVQEVQQQVNEGHQKSGGLLIRAVRKNVSPHAIWLNLQRPASACLCYWGRMLGECFPSIFRLVHWIFVIWNWPSFPATLPFLQDRLAAICTGFQGLGIVYLGWNSFSSLEPSCWRGWFSTCETWGSQMKRGGWDHQRVADPAGSTVGRGSDSTT